MIGSITSYAAHRKARQLSGGTLRAVQKACQTQRIHLEPDGRIDFEKADADWEANTNMRQRKISRKDSTGPPAETPRSSGRQVDDGTFLEAQRQREWERVKKERLERRILEGKLVDAEKVKDAVAGMIIAVRTKLLVIGDELADKLAAISDPVRCRELIDSRICQALDDLAQYPSKTL